VQAALFADAASFVLVAAMLALARSLPQVKAAAERTGTRMRAGLDYVRRNAVLAQLLAAEAVVLVFFTVVIPIEIVYAKETLDAGDSGYGALLSSWGIGMVLGSVVFSATGRRVSLKPLLLVSTLAIGISYLGMAAAGTLILACAAASVGGIGNGVQWVSVMSAVQELTATDYQARVAGLFAAIEKAMPGVGFLLGGVIAELVSPRASFLTAGIGVVAVVALMAPMLARSRWGDHPVGAPPADDAAAEAAELGSALGSDLR
jgi:MFS family permease